LDVVRAARGGGAFLRGPVIVADEGTVRSVC
jgi:hypothetical protein